MINIAIPGGTTLKIDNLVLDYNGTLALDGELIAGVLDTLKLLAGSVQIHVLTADTYGTVRDKVNSLHCFVHVIGEGAQDQQKADYVSCLGLPSVMAVGNGRNDALMLSQAALGVAVLQTEGLSPMAMAASDICCKNIIDALNLLLNPSRIQATLRN